MTSQSATLAMPKKASFWKRLIAFTIDNVMIAVLVVLIGSLFAMADVLEDFLAFIAYYAYGILLEYYRQRTLGKTLMNLKVIRMNRQKPTLWNSFNRNIGKMISALPYFYGFLRILAPHQRHTIHDELGKCLVIDTSNKKK